MIEDPQLQGGIVKCYISAPIGVNTENIRSSLEKKNVQLLYPSQLSARIDQHKSIVELISQADVVIGVLRRGRQTQAVLIELGMAAALGRKIVVFSPPKSGYIPFNLQPFVAFRIRLDNRKSIDFAINQVLSEPALRKKESSDHFLAHRTGKSPIPTQVDQLKYVLKVGEARRFEEIVTDAIKDSSVEVVVEPSYAGRVMDLAVWAEEFQYALGNPLLIEYKVKLENDEQIRATLKRCAAVTEESGGLWSLLIYGTSPKISRKHWSWIAPTVLTISALDLLKQMQDRSFVEVVVGLRNQRAHGGAR